ncbi:MAG: peptidoglycan-binding protein [Bryobacteraceae bacterium]|nr:peptidoglycan-binding protein [Bryobacteraceae bacterium]
MNARTTAFAAIAAFAITGFTGTAQSFASDGQRILNAFIGGGIQMMLNEAERGRQAPVERRIQETEAGKREPATRRVQHASGHREPRLNPDDIFLVQTRLNQLGHDVGTPDGVMGFDTKFGIMHYQQSIGAEPTGILTFSQFRTLVDGMPSAEEITSNNPDLLLPAEAKELQRALKARGYAVGKIDGVLGANSARAIAQFLRDSGHDPQQTSLRAAFELASGNSSAGTGTGRDLAGAVAGETAVRNAGESPVVIPAAFNLHIKDGAILTGDVSEMARGKGYHAEFASAQDYDRQLRGLSLQLTYQADPDTLERNPFLYVSLLSEEQRNRFILNYDESRPRSVDDTFYTELRALNEFEAAEVKREMVGVLRDILERSRISLPVDLMEVRLYTVANYDHETSSFPLRVDNAQARELRFSSHVPFIAPLPFSIWPERILLNEDSARSFLSNRTFDRGGYIATRMTLESATIDKGKLRFALRFKSGALYRDRELTEMDFDLAPYPGADLGGGAGAQEAGPSAAVSIEPDTPFALFAKEYPFISIPDGIWQAAARSRFHYEKTLLEDGARYAALPTKRFPEDLLRNNPDLRDSHVRVYRDSIKAQKPDKSQGILCPADLFKEEAGVVVKMNGQCRFDLESAVEEETLHSAANVALEEGSSYAVVMHNTALAGLLTFPVSRAEFDFEPRINLSDLADPNDISEAAFEFRIERIFSDVVERSGDRALFALNVRPTGIHVGKTFIPIEKLTRKIEVADISEFADIIGMKLGMSAGDAENALAAHRENLQDAALYRYTQPMDTPPASFEDAFDRWFESGMLMQMETYSFTPDPEEQAKCPECIPGRGSATLMDETSVFFDGDSEIASVNRYQAFPEDANVADVRELIIEKYGPPASEKENGSNSWFGIWAQHPLTRQQIQSGRQLDDICGVTGSDQNLTHSLWKDEKGAELSYTRSKIGSFHIKESVRDCGALLVANVGSRGMALTLIDTNWLVQRQQSLIALEKQDADDKRKKAIAPVRF